MSWDYRCSNMKQKFVIMGFWIQGFRCFPWMAVLFFLKDELNVDPRTLQILQNFYALPVVAKPLYGIVSDSFYIRGQRRVPYISLGVFLQAVSWLAVASLPPGGISISRVSGCLLLGNFGAAIVEVANDAIVMEMGRRPNPPPSDRDGLWSRVWTATAVGGMLGNLAGVACVGRLPPQPIFLFFALLLLLQLSAALPLTDASLALPPADLSAASGPGRRLSETAEALKKPEILLPLLWLLASFGIVPATTGTMFFYQTRHLGIGPSVLGFSKLLGQAVLLAWSLTFEKYFGSVPPRRVIGLVQAATALLAFSDALFVARVYLRLGIPDPAYVVAFSGVSEVIFFFKILPFSVVMTELCPPGREGSLMAVLMSVVAGGLVLGGCLGAVMASFLGLTVDDYRGLPLALLLQAVFSLVPLYCSSWIPDGVKSKGD